MVGYSKCADVHMKYRAPWQIGKYLSLLYWGCMVLSNLNRMQEAQWRSKRTPKTFVSFIVPLVEVYSHSYNKEHIVQVWCNDDIRQLLYSLVYLKMVHEDLHGTMFEDIILCSLTAVSLTRLLSDATPWLWQVVFNMVLWQDYVGLFLWLQCIEWEWMSAVAVGRGQTGHPHHWWRCWCIKTKDASCMLCTYPGCMLLAKL